MWLGEHNAGDCCVNGGRDVQSFYASCGGRRRRRRRPRSRSIPPPLPSAPSSIQKERDERTNGEKQPLSLGADDDATAERRRRRSQEVLALLHTTYTNFFFLSDDDDASAAATCVCTYGMCASGIHYALPLPYSLISPLSSLSVQ